MFLDRFIAHLEVEKRYSHHTVGAYVLEVRKLEAFLNQIHESVKTVTYSHFRQYFADLFASGQQASSINRARSAISTYYNFLIREGEVTQNPVSAIKALKKPRKLPAVVAADDLGQLLNEDSIFPSGFAGLRDRLVLEFLFGTGVRLAELLSIEVNDIDLYAKKVTVIGKRNKQRIIPLSNHLIKLIHEYLEARQQIRPNTNALIVTNSGNPAYSVFIYRLVKQYLSIVSKQSKRSPHVLRHTFATVMLENGADLNAIKEILGHANLAATQVYTHNSVDRLKKIYNQAHPRA
jgi:integrase/recombinase XerC